jgi:hypothetical protein
MISHSDLPTHPNGVLELLASTSTQIDVFSDQVIQSVKEGEQSPLKVLIQLKAFERCSERIQKEIKENYMTEADKYPGNEFEFLGNKVQKVDTYTKYDYSACGDPVYNQRLKLFEEAQKQLKERETFLKAVKADFSLLDEGTGEVVVIHPPKVNRSAGLKVFIK